jgi:hypothetical protein
MISEDLKSSMTKIITWTEQDVVENLIVLENWIKLMSVEYSEVAIALNCA